MLYEVYFDDSDRSTMSGYFDEPGSLEEQEAFVAVVEECIRCLEAGIFQSAKLYRDGAHLTTFKVVGSLHQKRGDETWPEVRYDSQTQVWRPDNLPGGSKNWRKPDAMSRR